jgi:integrase/recombinase XerD
VRQFLDHLERDRHCSVTTRNQRLGAIHSLAKFIATGSPEHVSWCAEIRKVPFKKAGKPAIPYLEKHEIEAVLKVPKRRTEHGERDYALLLFLYNTGARADETARVAVEDVTWGRSAAVRLHGKGNKIRLCPLWPKTAEVLKGLVGARAPLERVFLNRLGQPLTRFGIYALVRRAVTKAALTTPSLGKKRVSPHCIRHATACHLLRAGVDINTIRAWLGHVSLSTTNVYAEVDLEMKAKALERTDLGDGLTVMKRWRRNPGLIGFLRTL